MFFAPLSPGQTNGYRIARTRMRAREKSLKNFGLVPLRCRHGRRCRAHHADHADDVGAGDLAQDERRAIFEEQSRDIGIGMEYLPAVARRLHHSRELGEPFDFLTWFEYAPEHADAFEEMVRRLRSTAQWRYGEREVDIRASG